MPSNNIVNKHIQIIPLTLFPLSNQDILMSFYADESAMGCPGLMLILTKDTLYIGNSINFNNKHFYKKIINIEKHYSQLIILFGNGLKIGKTKRTNKDTYNYYYLGQGNTLLLREDYQKENNLSNPSIGSWFKQIHDYLPENIDLYKQSKIF